MNQSELQHTHVLNKGLLTKCYFRFDSFKTIIQISFLSLGGNAWLWNFVILWNGWLCNSLDHYRCYLVRAIVLPVKFQKIVYMGYCHSMFPLMFVFIYKWTQPRFTNILEIFVNKTIRGKLWIFSAPDNVYKIKIFWMQVSDSSRWKQKL